MPRERTSLVRIANPILWLALLTLLACKKEDPPPSTTACDTSSWSQPTSKLVGPGTEPLRHFKRGFGDPANPPRIAMTGVVLREGKPESVFGSWEIQTAWTPPSSHATCGRLDYAAIELGSPEDDSSEFAASMKRGMQQTIGLVHLRDNGIVTVRNGSLAKTVPDLMPVLEAFAPPLPTAPIGLGASWEVGYPQGEFETPLLLYKVESISNDGLHLSFSGAYQSPTSGKASGRTRWAGELELRADRMFPERATVSIHNEVELESHTSRTRIDVSLTR